MRLDQVTKWNKIHLPLLMSTSLCWAQLLGGELKAEEREASQEG